ncbi:hypothetical protein T265_11795 [Opisthorchis viverrini]|uniref:Reverse transcriptase domain-containing protein n=1 Tax=Opisthorchis viverrini TaxID=6198 RepID=A0A074Z1R4_OPIVI|nr:hypothetical protein T265_11795 [Opisthorchis viverrini]KER19432.1 hypothetical protein T265_11795 [Opisthorchis viverrini]
MAPGVHVFNSEKQINDASTTNNTDSQSEVLLSGCWSVRRAWQLDCGDINGTLGKEEICELLELCMTTYFEFNGEYYEQIKGAPMGSPISGFIAEITMQKLERIVLPDIKPKIWVRYLDDIFAVVKKKERTDWVKGRQSRKTEGGSNEQNPPHKARRKRPNHNMTTT